MTPTKLAAAAALALLTATGCGTSGGQEVVPAGSGERTEQGPQATERPEPEAEPGPPAEDPGPRSGHQAASGRTGEPSQDPRGEPSPGEGGGKGEEPRNPGEQGEAPEEAVEAYVSALARTGEPERMGEGLEHTATASTAHAYLTHQRAVAQARADEGHPLRNAEAERTKDGYELCLADDPDSKQPCVEYSGFGHQDGMLTGLLVDGRDPAPGLLVADGVEDESAGVRATLLTAYQSVTDKSLVVTVEFTTADSVDLGLPQAFYQRRGGSQYRPQEAVGRYGLDADSTTHAAFFFPGAVPGGSLAVDGCLEECSALVDIELPVG